MSRGSAPAELVIFDCDGVLVDSEPAANRVFTEALNRVGLTIGYDEVCREFVGLSMQRCVEIVESRLGRSLPERFLDDLQERTFEAFRSELTAVAGIEAVLDRLQTPFCVASSGEIEKMRFTLGMTGLLPRFEGRMFSATEVPRGKPWPDLFLHAASSIGTDPPRCVVVEDSVPGVRAGRAAGMPVLGFAERSDPARLADAGAEVFRDMRELPGLLGLPEPRIAPGPQEPPTPAG